MKTRSMSCLEQQEYLMESEVQAAKDMQGIKPFDEFELQ
jgi:hypothetical protein